MRDELFLMFDVSGSGRVEVAVDAFDRLVIDIKHQTSGIQLYSRYCGIVDGRLKIEGSVQANRVPKE